MIGLLFTVYGLQFTVFCAPWVLRRAELGVQFTVYGERLAVSGFRYKNSYFFAIVVTFSYLCNRLDK